MRPGRALFISEIRQFQDGEHAAGKKRILRNAKRTEINRNRVSRIRTFVKQVESALAAGNKDEAKAALARVQPELFRGVARGVLHKNTASRKLSRLTRRLVALG